MKILFVSAVFPFPLFSGGQVRIYNLLKRLSKKHDISLYTFIRNTKEEQYVKELAFCKKVVTVMRGPAWQYRYIARSLMANYPFLYATYNNKLMQELIRQELTSHYDLIHIEPGYVYMSLPDTKIPIVVSEHNIEHDVYKKYVDNFRIPLFRPMMQWDVAKMDRWEQFIWKQAAQVTATSDGDSAWIHTVVGKNKVSLVTNGVDAEKFMYVPKKTISVDRLVFLYVGNFSWIQNTDAVRRLLKDTWPFIRHNYPTALLKIIGKNLPKNLRNLSSNGVTFIDSVVNIEKEYKSADILLAPIRVGGGTKYKIIESMASGLPVITTTIGAAGITAQGRQVFWIADTNEEILKSIRDISDSSERKNVLSHARKLVEDKFSWEQIANTLEQVWRHAYEQSH